MGTNSLARWGFLAAAFLLVFEVRANSIRIDIDTDALGLSGQNWDLAFDLVQGDVTQQFNAVSISSFGITGGSLTTNTPFFPSSGNFSGNLSVSPGVVTLNTFDPADPSFFNEYTHNANIGSSMTFILDLTENAAPGLVPDAFSFYFLDPATGFPLDTADPTGALFVYSIGNDNQPALFCPTTAPCITVTPIQQAAPEPGTLMLALAALVALFRMRPTRRSFATVASTT